MIDVTKMKIASALVIIWTALFVSSAVAQNGGKTLLPVGGISGNSLNGAWKLNRSESDDLAEKVRALMQSSKAATVEGTAEQDKANSLSISLLPPDALILSDGDAEMTINENYENVVQTRTVATDGQMRFYRLNTAADFSVTATGKSDRLVIETKSPHGNLMTEIYELLDNNKLRVIVRIENQNSEEILTLRRIYDRTALDIFSGQEMEIQ